LNAVFLGLAIAWAVCMVLAPKVFPLPPLILLLPMPVFLVVKIARSFWLYSKRVPCGLPQRIGAAFAAMSLAHTVGKAVIHGLLTSGRPFLRTPKLEGLPAIVRALVSVREEAIWFAAAVTAAGLATFYARGYGPSKVLFSTIILLQAMPYLASILVALAGVVLRPDYALATSWRAEDSVRWSSVSAKRWSKETSAPTSPPPAGGASAPSLE
jgi:hypothetical protein